MKKPMLAWAFGDLAEAVRFELTEGRPSPVFKTGAFNRSATLPGTVFLGGDRKITPAEEAEMI